MEMDEHFQFGRENDAEHLIGPDNAVCCPIVREGGRCKVGMSIFESHHRIKSGFAESWE